MMTWVLGLLATFGLARAGLVLVARYRLNRLQAYQFPDYLRRRVEKTYSHLTPGEADQVIEGLRQFFAVSIRARGRPVAMPSHAVDEAWHEFILSTRAYRQFCLSIVGRFLHHTPAEAMRSPWQATEGVRRTWAIACRLEGIDPQRPGRLPLLFALDGRLKIPGGFVYNLNCGLGGAAAVGGGEFCASHIGCFGGAGCAGDSGGDGDGGGDGGGCGGD